MKKLLVIMSVTVLTLITAVVLSQQCNDCEIDSTFAEKFDAHLVVLESFALKDMGSVDLDEVLKSVGYISAVSEIKSQIYLGDVILYEPGKFRQDRKRWKKWFEKNKCTMTSYRADSLFQVNTHLRPDSKPPTY